MEFDYKKIDNVELGGLDYEDSPKFCDAYIESADYDGRPMTEVELDKLSEDGDFVFQAIQNYLY